MQEKNSVGGIYLNGCIYLYTVNELPLVSVHFHGKIYNNLPAGDRGGNKSLEELPDPELYEAAKAIETAGEKALQAMARLEGLDLSREKEKQLFHSKLKRIYDELTGD